MIPGFCCSGSNLEVLSGHTLADYSVGPAFWGKHSANLIDSRELTDVYSASVDQIKFGIVALASGILYLVRLY